MLMLHKLSEEKILSLEEQFKIERNRNEETRDAQILIIERMEQSIAELQRHMIIKFNDQFSDSVILDDVDKRSILLSFIEKVPNTAVVTKKLYQASKDGWQSSDFHRCCDLKGPNVTIIKS